jgi:ABC-type uncharacterized transport system substrate-binding protein
VAPSLLVRAGREELVARHPDAIFVPHPPWTAALLAETRMIPIVFVNVADPIGAARAGFPAILRQQTG